MNPITLLEQLNQISLVTAIETEDHRILVTNALATYDLNIHPEDIIDTDFVAAPTGERVLRISMHSGGVIVTPDDYVFNVEQDEMIRVDDAPPMCSIVEMINGFERYIENPMPTDDMDICVGLFYIHYYILKSARKKGFNVDSFKDKLDAIGQEFGLNVNDVRAATIAAPIHTSQDIFDRITILDVGGEGGGYAIFGEQRQGQWWFWLESNFCIFEDDQDCAVDDAIPATPPNESLPKSSPCYVKSLDEALETIKSVWPDLYPAEVHPAFAKEIWQRAIAHWRDHWSPQTDHVISVWSQLCLGRKIVSLDELDLVAWDLPAHWHSFASAVRKTMAEMAEDQFIILLCKGSNRFVQVATQHMNIRVEATSNYHLSGRDALSAKDIKALRRLGWLAPTGTPEQATPEYDPGGSSNFFLDVAQPVDYAQLTTLLVKTLSGVMGVPHDGYMAYTAFGANGGGDVSYPNLGIKREVTDPNLRMAELAERLLSVIQEASGCPTLAFNSDGDIELDMAGQNCLIRLVGQPPMVRFVLPLLVGISPGKKLLEQINQLNLRGAPVCHVWVDDAVFAVQDIPAWPLQAQHIDSSLTLFTDTASKSALWLQSEFGMRASVLNPTNTSH